jgi:hypothetical protein
VVWFNMSLVPGSVYVHSQQIQGQEVVKVQVRDDLGQLGEAVVAMHQRLQGSPMDPPPQRLMGRRRGGSGTGCPWRSHCIRVRSR